MRVIAFAQYLTSVDVEWRRDDHASSKFVKAIKGDKPFNGYANIPTYGRLEWSSRQKAVIWFGDWAARRIQKKVAQRPIVLVPVPSHDTVLGTTTPSGAAKLATSIMNHIGAPKAAVLDILRWDREMTPSHAGGEREARLLYPHLRTLPFAMQQAAYVLVDDVHTSGGHLRACAGALVASGIQPVLAICAGRTVQEPVADPFSIPEEELTPYDPDNLWDSF